MTCILRTILENRIMILTIEVTNICNANCQFCAYKHQKRMKLTMSDELFRHSIYEFVKFGGGILNLTPTAGDPLVDKDLVNRIRFAKQMKCINYIVIYTNLIGLDNFTVRKLLSSGLDELNVSTCIGSREMYNRVYGVDEYDHVTQNLHSLLRENRALGDKVWLIVHVKGEKPHDTILSSSEYQRIADLYGRNTCHIDGEYDNWTGMITKDDLPKGHTFKQLKNMSEPCSELYDGLIIHVNGDIGICARRDLEATLTIGNIYQESLETVWKGKALRNMRENWRKGNIPTICKTCYSYLPLSNLLSLVRMKLFGRERVKLV